MTQTGKYVSYKNADWNKGIPPEDLVAIADVHLVRNRKGYDYELDAVMLNDGSTRPSREPRVAAMMPAYLRYGDGQPFTLREAIDASFDAGRHSYSWSYRYHKREGATQVQLKDMTIRDHWVLANTSDTLSCATRCHLKLVLRDATIELEKVSLGVYMFHCNPPTQQQTQRTDLLTHDEFVQKYQKKFEREGEAWPAK